MIIHGIEDSMSFMYMSVCISSPCPPVSWGSSELSRQLLQMQWICATVEELHAWEPPILCNGASSKPAQLCPEQDIIFNILDSKGIYPLTWRMALYLSSESIRYRASLKTWFGRKAACAHGTAYKIPERTGSLQSVVVQHISLNFFWVREKP